MTNYSMTPFATFRQDVGIVQSSLAEVPAMLREVADDLASGFGDANLVQSRLSGIAGSTHQAAYWAGHAAAIPSERPVVMTHNRFFRGIQRAVQEGQARTLTALGVEGAASHVSAGAMLAHDTSQLWATAPHLADPAAVRRLAIGVEDLLLDVAQLSHRI